MGIEWEQRGWLVYAFADERQYAGNDPYSDVVERRYLFDSNVPNSRNIQESDILIVSGRSWVLGVARAEQIDCKPGTKVVYRCPECGTTGIKRRKKSNPAYRCNAGHVFVEPMRDIVSVTLYIAEFGDSFVAIPRGLRRHEALNTSNFPGAQLSIRQVDLKLIWPSLLALSPKISRLYPQNMHSEYLAPNEGVSVQQKVDLVYSQEETDVRAFAMRLVRARRGQAAFRLRLRERYGDICLISGCTLLDVIEAAHISPYRGINDQRPDNGILLRSDLHTLFDLDLLGINPDTLKVHLHPSIRDPQYLELAGRRLLTGSHFSPSPSALLSRWKLFQKRASKL